MATQSRSALQTTINTNLANNVTNSITPTLHREVATNVNDSTVNKTTDLGSSTGVVVQTDSSFTIAKRTLTGTSEQITVTNGDGVTANPTMSLPSTLTPPGAVRFIATQTAAISAGAIAGTSPVILAQAETGTTDDLTDISGQIGLLLLIADAGDTITLKDNGSDAANKIRTFAAADQDLSETGYTWLYRRTTSDVWKVVGGGGGGGSTEFADDVFRVTDNSDTSKKIALEASAITTSTTRTVTALNTDGYMAVTSAVLAANRIPYATGAVGLLTSSASFTCDGTDFSVGGSTINLSSGDITSIGILNIQSVGDIQSDGGSNMEINADDDLIVTTAGQCIINAVVDVDNAAGTRFFGGDTGTRTVAQFTNDSRDVLKIQRYSATESGQVRFFDDDNTYSVAVRAPSTFAASASYVLELPTDAPSATEVLTVTGYSGGVISTEWAAGGGGSSTDEIVITIGDGVNALTTGLQTGFRCLAFAGTPTAWYIVSDQASGSVVADIVYHATAIPTASDSIAGSEKPTLSSAQKNSDTSLSTWSTFAAGGLIGLDIESISGGIAYLNIVIKYTKS